MLADLTTGKEFYYADREQQRPIKCRILNVKFGYPTTIIAKNTETNLIFDCYDGFGVYSLNEYNEALKDAKIQEDRIIY